MKIRYYDRGDKIWLDIRTDAGGRYRISSGKLTMAEAELATPALLAALLPNAATTASIPHSAPAQAQANRVTGFSLQHAFDRAWLEHDKWLQCKDVQGKHTTFNALLATPGISPTMDCGLFTYDRVMALRALWLKEEGKRKGSKLSNSTINHRLSMLTTLLEVIRCPPHGVKHLSVINNRRNRRVREDELQAMVTWCLANHHRKGATSLADLILVGLSTAARMSEWLDMQWNDVYFDKATVIYRDTKNGSSRQGTLDDTCMRILERRRSYGASGPFEGLPKSTAASLWSDGRKAIGLEHDHEFVFHVATRHEGLSRLGDAGVSILQMKAFGGHTSIAALDRYVHPSLEGQRSLAGIITGNRDTPQSGTDA